MSQFLVTIVFLVAFVVPPSLAADDFSELVPIVTVSHHTASVYERPDSAAEVVSLVSEGDRLPVLRREGKWLQVISKQGVGGWIDVAKVRFGPVPPTAPLQTDLSGENVPPACSRYKSDHEKRFECLEDRIRELERSNEELRRWRLVPLKEG